MITVCAWCGDVKHPVTGKWAPPHPDQYSPAPINVTHGICPDCEAEVTHDLESHPGDCGGGYMVSPSGDAAIATDIAYEGA